MKRIALAAFTALVFGGTAFAAQNVANTSQKGSLLIFPLINVDPAEGADTLIEISNDAYNPVRVKCYYVNERKGRVDFHFLLTGKQTVSWFARSRAGDQVTPAKFPIGGAFTGGPNTPYPEYPVTNAYRGALICFATNTGVNHQIAWNHLAGTAQVTDSSGTFRYNAWSFAARNAQGLPERNGVLQGTAGRLNLTGNGAGTYDACPVYNIANFMPNGAGLGAASVVPPPTPPGLQTTRNVLSIVSCNQDLQQNAVLYLTKLQFTVWNSREEGFTGAHICVDSVHSVHLGAGNSYLENGSNFDFDTVGTANARFQVSGVASIICPKSRNAALLGVLASETTRGEVGSTTHTAGAAPGFVLWDPSPEPPLFTKTSN